MIYNRCRSTIEVFEESRRSINAEMMINGCKEIACRTSPFDRVFASFVRCSDDPPCLNSSACPYV